VKGLRCAEPGCDGTLILRWSPRFNTYFYGCEHYPKCEGTLPADRAGAPRGRPRTKELQGWRAKAHEVFDTIWKEHRFPRTLAYAWMRRVMVLPPDEAHIFKLDIEGCQKLIKLVEEKGPGTEFWRSWYKPGKRVTPKKGSGKRKRKRRRRR